MKIGSSKKRLNGSGWLLFAFALLVLAYYLPAIDQPDCTTRAQLLPMEYFRIEQFDNGRLQTLQGHHWPKSVSSSSSFIPQRGDWFFLHFTASGQTYVKAGDTLFTLYSRNWEQDLIRMEGVLAEEYAKLHAMQAGRKPETIQRLRKERELVAEQLALRQKQYDRAVELLSDSLISLADFERAESLLAQAKEAYRVASAALEEAEAGVQPQTIQAQKARILRIEQQKKALEERAWISVIEAPFSGVLHYRDLHLPEQSLVLEATPPSEGVRRWEVWRSDSMVLRIPIPITCLSRVEEHTDLVIHFPEGSQRLSVQLKAENWLPHVLNGREVVYYLAKTPWFEHPLTGGSYPCTLLLRKAGVREYWKELFF